MAGLKHGTATGYSYYKCRCGLCSEVHSKKMREWREQVWGVVEAPNHGTVTGYSAYRCRCDDCRKAKRMERLKRRYGVNAEDVSKMISEQGGRCPLCCVELRDRYVVDHDHKTGSVRGLLCSSCNQALGKFQDNSGIVRRAIEYLS